MKNVKSEPIEIEDDDMRPEYDFRGGVRGKYAEAYRQGYTITIHNGDGSTTVQHFPSEQPETKHARRKRAVKAGNS